MSQDEVISSGGWWSARWPPVGLATSISGLRQTCPAGWRELAAARGSGWAWAGGAAVQAQRRRTPTWTSGT
jgi:hypothetical protein